MAARKSRPVPTQFRYCEDRALAQIAEEICELCLVINLNEKKFRLMVTRPLFERNGYVAAPTSFG